MSLNSQTKKGGSLLSARQLVQPEKGSREVYNYSTKIASLVLCAREDLNLHVLTDTRPSSVPVYQFQHLRESPRPKEVAQVSIPTLYKVSNKNHSTSPSPAAFSYTTPCTSVLSRMAI